MRTRISSSLFADDARVCCSTCAKALCSTDESWKGKAALSVLSVAELPGAGRNVERRAVLRRFSCPHCGQLLDTETALPEDPYLDDLIKI
jgi:acetone carboxylase gamma subunit